ncbi:hypothetical protein DIPPA_30780 [Diplonema papillatum]|nr:hypothetical protein DIPPA_30780 [Diplonema papillatum]
MSPVPAPPPLRAVKASLAQQWPRVHRLMQSLSPAGCDCAPLAAVRDALVADTTVAGTDRERLALSALLSQCTEAAAGCQRQRRCRPAKPATSRAAARYAAEPPYADSRQTTNTCTHMHALSHAPSIQTHNPCTILQQNPATSRVAARYAAEPPYADSRQTTDTYTHTPREASCHDACLEDSRVCQEPDNAKTQAGHSVMKSLPMPGAILPPTGPDAMVSCRQLRRFVQRPPSTAPAGWKRRFRTAGVMPLPLQRSTAGVERCPQVSEGPPYAISRDAECMQALVDEYIVTRCRRMSDCLRRHGSPDREGWLTTEEFAAALRKVERYGTSAREVEALVDVLDPKNTGFVGIQDFLTRFAIEFLKGKSSRLTIGTDGNDGRVNLMQWPESLRTTYSKDRLLEALRRRRRFGRPPRGKVPETKTVVRTTRR